MHWIRFGGTEYGPFSEKQIRAWLQGRTISAEDTVFEPLSGKWLPLKDWVAVEQPETSTLDSLSVPSTYSRIAVAGMILILLWASAFIGYRIWTGRWPMQPAHEERSPFLPQNMRHGGETGT